MSSLMAPPVSFSYAPDPEELFPPLPELELLPPEPEEPFSPLPELELLPPEPDELFPPLPELELLPPEPDELLFPPELFPPALTIAWLIIC